MSEINKALIRRWCSEGFNKNNMAIADEVYGANVIYHEPSAGEVIGLEPLKQFVVSWRAAFPDSLLTIEEQVAENDHVATRWHSHRKLPMARSHRQARKNGRNVFLPFRKWQGR
jgi:predicted ester cyclase